LNENCFRTEDGRAVRTAPALFIALGPGVGVVRIMIDSRARTGEKRLWRLQRIIRRLIYQSLDCLATSACFSITGKRGGGSAENGD